jgi:hypothetical protein
VPEPFSGVIERIFESPILVLEPVAVFVLGGARARARERERERKGGRERERERK